MPLIRKIVGAGRTSRAVIIPKSWIDFAEKEAGQRIREVTIEVNGSLVIRPILPKESKKT